MKIDFLLEKRDRLWIIGRELERLYKIAEQEQTTSKRGNEAAQYRMKSYLEQMKEVEEEIIGIDNFLYGRSGLEDY